MKTIHKFEIHIGKQSIELPASAEILSVAAQNDALYFWALIETQQATAQFKVDVVATGTPANYSLRAYKGTIHTPYYVWHVFIYPAS